MQLHRSLVLAESMYFKDSFVDLLSNTRHDDGISLGSDIEEIAQQRKQENRDNLVANVLFRFVW